MVDIQNGLAAKLAAIEYEMLVETLRLHNGNASEAARELGLTRRTMGLRMKKYNVTYKEFRRAESRDRSRCTQGNRHQANNLGPYRFSQSPRKTPRRRYGGPASGPPLIIALSRATSLPLLKPRLFFSGPTGAGH